MDPVSQSPGVGDRSSILRLSAPFLLSQLTTSSTKGPGPASLRF